MKSKIHQRVLVGLVQQLQEDKNNLAFFVTGSVARDEATKTSDLDLLLITKEGGSYKEKLIGGIMVEMKSNTLEGFIEKMDKNSMNIYQWLDAELIFGDRTTLDKLKNHAQKILKLYVPPELSRKWLDSGRIKIIAAWETGDNINLGFQISNILWKIVEGLYILNREPLPPNTTAFRRITTLKKLPDNFESLWNKMLTADLEQRAGATLELLNFLLI